MRVGNSNTLTPSRRNQHGHPLVVGAELLLIAWIRFHYFRVQLVRSGLQVIAGGALVFTTGVLIGGA